MNQNANPTPGEDILDKEKTFASFQLDDRLLKAISKMGFAHPTLIQATAIPLALQGKDVLARARTGSGKTAAYALPIIQSILLKRETGHTAPGVKAIVVVPTRELCEQTRDYIAQLCAYSKYVSVFSLRPDDKPADIKARFRSAPDIVVSTPSKLAQMLLAQAFTIRDTLQMFVVDEADLVMTYGYSDDMKVIVKYLPQMVQGFLMSATLSDEVQELKQLVLHNPVVLTLEETTTSGPSALTEYAIRCSQQDKYLIVYALVRLKVIPGKALFFVNTIEECYRLRLFFERFHIKSAVLNSELPHNARYHIVQEFNKGIFDYLIATDESVEGTQEDEDEAEQGDEEEIPSDEDTPKATKDNNNNNNNNNGNSNGKKDSKKNSAARKASLDREYGVARGIDFKKASTVVNFDCPASVRSYTHRVGRTARGTSSGTALTLVTPAQEQRWKKIEEKRKERNLNVFPYTFNIDLINGFRYRVEDQLNSISTGDIRKARIEELKQEIMNSERLQQHFKENPHDLALLQHTKSLQKVKQQEGLKYIPDYLVPQSLQPNTQALQEQQKKDAKKKKTKAGLGFGKKDASSSSSFMSPEFSEKKKRAGAPGNKFSKKQKR